MKRTRIALTSLALFLVTATLVAQAPPPVTPISTANSAGSGPLDRLYFPVDRSSHAVGPRRWPVRSFTELRRGVGMFIGTGGTIGYLVNGDGAIAVDSQFMNTAEICAAGLRQRAPKGIAMLLNTHHHGDHTGGNKAYGVSKIVAHANCLKSHKAVTEEAKTESY